MNEVDTQVIGTVELRNGDIKLKQRSDGKDGVWHYQIRLPDGGYDRKSTKCKVLEEAKQIAETRWQEIKYRAGRNLSITGYPFDKAADAFVLAEQRNHVAKRKVKDAALRRMVRLVETHLKPYFKSKSLADITNADLDAYHVWYHASQSQRDIRVVIRKRSKGKVLAQPVRLEMSAANYKHPKAEAIAYAASVLRRIFALAVRHGHILATEQPHFATEPVSSKRRGAFSRHEIAVLLKHVRGAARSAPNQESIDCERLLAAYVRVLLATGCRPGVECQFGFQDFTYVKGAKPHVLVSVRDGKTGPRTVLAPIKLRGIIEGLRKHHPDPRPDALIWTKTNQEVIVDFTRRFRGHLDQLGMLVDGDGNERSLYSLRHTFITRCIERGMNHSFIAKNCGNSLMIIERNYNHIVSQTMVDELYKTGA